MVNINFVLLLFPLSSAQLFARSDASEGGGDPNVGGGASTGPLSNWVNKPGQDPTAPTKDQFYTKQPTNLTEYANGEIISKRPIGLDGTYQGVHTAYQVRIRSQDAHDQPALSVASVLMPRSSNSNGNVVVYQVPEDAVYIDCSPTFQLFSRNAVSEIQGLISQGFTVVVPDYEGVRGSFTVGKLAGKHILDAARAALQIPGVKSTNGSTSIGLWGYGTAAHSTGWAAELHASYAPELPIKAVALGGVVSNLTNWIDAVNGTPAASNYVTSLLGMASEYRDVSDALADNVIARKRQQFEGAATRCSGANLVHFFAANITSQFFTPGVDVIALEKVQNVYDLNSLGKNAPKASLYVYQGTSDNVANPGDVHELLKFYCSKGTAVKYHELADASHNQARNSYQDAIQYLQSILSGEKASNTCDSISGDFNF